MQHAAVLLQASSEPHCLIACTQRPTAFRMIPVHAPCSQPAICTAQCTLHAATMYHKCISHTAPLYLPGEHARKPQRALQTFVLPIYRQHLELSGSMQPPFLHGNPCMSTRWAHLSHTEYSLRQPPLSRCSMWALIPWSATSKFKPPHCLCTHPNTQFSASWCHCNTVCAPHALYVCAMHQALGCPVEGGLCAIGYAGCCP